MGPTPTLATFPRFSQAEARYTGFSSTDSSFEDPADSPQPFLGGGNNERQLESGGSSTDDEGDEAVSGLGLSVPTTRSERAEGKRRQTITTPFSRPPSAVTVPYLPSRPPSSAALDTRAPATITSSSRQGSSHAHQRRSRRAVGPAEALSAGSPHGRVSDGDKWGFSRGRGEGGRSGREEEFSSGERKGKGKARERPTSWNHATANDPLDLMAALRHATPHPAQANNHPTHQRVPSYEPIAFPAYPSSSSIGSGSQPTSTSSASGPSAPQSLQQLLQTVDLSAALLLVQTLQSQQPQNASVPTLSTALPSPPKIPNSSHPSLPSPTRPLPHQTSSTILSDESGAASVAESSDVHTPLLSSPFTTSSSPQRVSIDESPKPRPLSSIGIPGSSSGTAGTGEKKDRRRSLSLNFGVGNVGKRLRTGSSAQGSLWESKNRVPDARAVLGEGGRGFEEQISRVHLTLSPATLRRAQNCAKYLSLRYTPLYSSITSALPIPNLVAVSRWRDKREEYERNQRRARVGTGGRTRTRDDGGTDGEGARNPDARSGARSETGSSTKGGLLSLNPRFATPVYGPRRNKHPKAWEIYPDEVAEFVAAGGRVDEQEPEAKALSDTGAGLRTFPSRGTNGSSSSIKLEDRLRPSGIRAGSPTGSVDKGSSLRPPTHSRSNSYEGSPLARTNGARRTSLEPPSLRRAGSYGSTSPHPTPNTPFSTLTTISSMESGAPKGRSNNYASGGAQSGQSSREHLPTVSSPPRPSLGSPKANGSPRSRLPSPQPNGSSTTNKPPVSESIRSNLSRRLDRIRKKPTTDVETSDVGRSAPVASGSVTDLAWTPDVSEGEGLLRSPPRAQQSFSDQGKFRRSRTRKNGTDGTKSAGIDSTDGPSGGEDGQRTRRGRFLAAAWQGFRGSVDTYPGGEGALPVGVAAEEGGARRRIVYVDESDDEDVKVPREVLDLGNAEFLKLNGLLRQLRTQLAEADKILPRVPADINGYLDDITRHETSTRLSFGIPVEYSFPRLSASVVSQLANSKQRDYANGTTEHSSGSSSDSSSLSSSNESDDDELPDALEHGERRPSVRFHASPRQRVVKVHARRVTDPISRATVVRSRSRTVGSPLAANREVVRESETRVDRLGLLEKAAGELRKAAKEVDVEAERLAMYQDRVGNEIAAVNRAVDEVQLAINRENFQQLRKLEEHYTRLRTSLTRPSSAIDVFWAVLSYVLTVLFYLSWLAVTLFRIFRTLLGLPITAIRWLLFLR